MLPSNNGTKEPLSLSQTAIFLYTSSSTEMEIASKTFGRNVQKYGAEPNLTRSLTQLCSSRMPHRLANTPHRQMLITGTPTK